MMRSYLKFGMLAAALIGMSATNTLAGDLGLIVNGDMEVVSRFAPHGDPGTGDTPAGIPDGWHHSGHTGWSNPGDPVLSPTHSLRLSDFAGAIGGVFNPPTVDPTLGMEEGRSFATAIPGVGNLGRSLDLSWNWDWDITSGTVFTATVRISDAPVVSFDLVGTITDHNFFTDGSASSGGFQTFLASIPLGPTDASFDIIYNTGDRSLNDPDPGKLDAIGSLFVDDVSAGTVPEPTSLLLLSFGGIMVMGRRQRG